MRLKIMGLVLMQLVFSVIGWAQDCDSNYFSLTYKGRYFNNILGAVVTPQNELLSFGDLSVYDRAYMTKVTSQGTVIWSNEYNVQQNGNGLNYFAGSNITDVALDGDSGYIAIGSFSHERFIINSLYTPAVYGTFFVHIDKFGVPHLGRQFQNTMYGIIDFIKVKRLNNGNFVVFVTTSGGGALYFSRLICMDANGTLKWQSTLNTDKYGIYTDGPPPHRSIAESKNGTIIVGDIVGSYSFSDPSGPKIVDEALHFYSLDPNNGTLVWENSFSDSAGLHSGIENITETPDGNFSFLTTVSVSAAGNGLPPYARKVANIITDSKGAFVNMFCYSSAGNSSELIDAAADRDGQVILFKDASGTPILTRIDSKGAIQWSKGYGNTSMHLSPVAINRGNKSYFINFTPSLNDALPFVTQLLITDPAGKIECANTPVTIVQESYSKWPYQQYHVNSSIRAQDNLPSQELAVTIVASSYPLETNTDCQRNISCCKDIVDTSNVTQVALCNGDSYTLPDNSVIRDSGQYYVNFTTAKGCDSVALFHIVVSKNPKDLELTADTCLAGKDSLVLHATDGYDNYSWMNIPGGQSTYTVREPGAYWVTVQNFCGLKTDTSQVYDLCEYPILLPNAFTPNNDGHNDFFRIPAQNKNRLVKLRIYNRWGELVFSTADKSKGWDGSYKNNPQPTGTYVYFIEMKGIDGAEFSQKGTLLLLR